MSRIDKNQYFLAASPRKVCTSFAFQYCNSLTTVTINAANLETYGENAFLNANSGMKIYVPYGSGNTYKTGWPDYASKIEELEDPNATYTVKLAENTDDATNWTITPADATDPEKGVKKDTEVKATYSGKKRVKSVTAVTKGAGPTLAATLTTADMTVKVKYNYIDQECYCLFKSNGDVTYTF